MLNPPTTAGLIGWYDGTISTDNRLFVDWSNSANHFYLPGAGQAQVENVETLPCTQVEGKLCTLCYHCVLLLVL